jgi:enoyl-[acyl-carrier protein] reductase III
MSKVKKISALITGGTRGIGRAISLKLAESGIDTLIVNYLQNETEAANTKKLIEANGSKAILARANLLYPNEIDRLFEVVEEHTNRLDILIHCAALGTFKPLSKIKLNHWDLTININARAFLYCVQKSLSLMKEGNIVAISSLGGQRVVPNYGAMGPTKAALEATVRYLAVELAPLGIRVNGITGGFIETSSIKKFPNLDKMKREVIARTPAKRIGTPEDIANSVIFLISPEAGWIYGQNLIVDGGFSLQ